MSLVLLPDEVVHHLLHYVPPEDTLLAFQFLCKRLKRLANVNVLWKYYCRSSFTYWDQQEEYSCMLREPASKTSWKRMYLVRRSRNNQISTLLDGIIASKVGRIEKMEKVCRLGYDAKDFLLSQCRSDPTADDFLARR